MDIAAISTMSAQGKVQNQSSLLMMRKVMDTSEQNGQAVLDLLASISPRVSPPYLGQTIDISA